MSCPRAASSSEFGAGEHPSPPPSLPGDFLTLQSWVATRLPSVRVVLLFWPVAGYVDEEQTKMRSRNLLFAIICIVFVFICCAFFLVYTFFWTVTVTRESRVDPQKFTCGRPVPPGQKMAETAQVRVGTGRHSITKEFSENESPGWRNFKHLQILGKWQNVLEPAPPPPPIKGMQITYGVSSNNERDWGFLVHHPLLIPSGYYPVLSK